MCAKKVLQFALTLEEDERSGTTLWWLTQRQDDSPATLLSEGLSGSLPNAFACLWSLVDAASSAAWEMRMSEH